MRIEAETNADMTAITIKRNQKHDGQLAYLDLELAVKQAEAAQFGEHFGKLAFSSMTEVGDEGGATKIIHLIDNPKPSKRCVYERHVIVLDGVQITEQPELLSIATIDGEARVIAKFRVPVATTQKKLLTSLIEKVGQVVSVQFNPEQELLGLSEKPSLQVVD